MTLTGSYRSDGFHDLMIEPDGTPRAPYRALAEFFRGLDAGALRALHGAAELSLVNQGITFTVYSDARGTEKILPFDPVPRIVTPEAWGHVEAGIAQRLVALNLFLQDLYGDQKVLRDGVVPTALVVNSRWFCREMAGITPPGGVFVHVAGVDLIQDEHGRFLVLEDNLRVPSGVSYVLENRAVMSRIVPDLLQRHAVRGVDTYPTLLLEALTSLSPRPDPTVALLTPGVFNSAYFEHSFLAGQMGAVLVEGQDLLVDDDVLYMRTTEGLQRVDVVYRRVDDDFLDPLAFRADSLLGVTGLMNAFRAGNVALANAPGTGVADDKAMYAYLPEVIRYYLGEDPILPQVPTYLGRRPADLRYMAEHLETLVLKPTDGSGGYGIVVGSSATRAELATAREALRADPAHFIAQPIQRLATLPTFDVERGEIGPRHVDLRPFAVQGVDGRVRVLPGGLTRVALRRGSLVVNSSQGADTKDTWVLERLPEEPPCRC